MKKSTLTRTIEVISNFVILGVGLVVAIVLIRTYVSGNSPRNIQRPVIGSTLTIFGEAFAPYSKNVIIAVADGCHYCSESAAFYQQLARQAVDHKDLHLILAVPEDNPVSYAETYHLSQADIKKVNFKVMKIGGTPTIILADKNGRVNKVWMGKLPSSLETEVMEALGLKCDQCTLR